QKIGADSYDLIGLFAGGSGVDTKFDTVGDLAAKLATLSVGAVVETKGCLLAGDGGHGTFDIVASTALPVDGYSVISNSGKFAVLRRQQGAVNPLQFGAVDNSVDDDTAAIRRANAFTKAMGGGVIDFLDRAYRVKRVTTSGETGATPDDYIILLDYDNVTLRGIKGKAKIVHDISDTDFSFARIGKLPINNGVVSLKDIVIDGLEIDGGYTPI